MPSLFDRLSQELRDMIFPQFLVTDFDQTSFPAFITAFKGTRCYPILVNKFYQINNMVTESNQLAWKVKSLKETKKIGNLLIVFHGDNLKMNGDKLKLINHTPTISLDLSHYQYEIFTFGFDVQYLIQASTRMKKVTIRAPAKINIGVSKTFMEEGLGGRAVPDEQLVMLVPPGGFRPIPF